MGDLNERVRDKVREYITGTFGRIVVDLCVGNMCFKYKKLHNKIKMARVRDEGGVMCMINSVLVERNILKCVQDVKTMKRMGQDTLDHSVILCKVRLVNE